MQKITFLPISISLEELAEQSELDSFELSDNNASSNKMMFDLEFESIIIQLLHSFSDKKKIIFLFQLLKSTGFNLTQDELRKTVHLQKKDYYLYLKEIRESVKAISKAV